MTDTEFSAVHNDVPIISSKDDQYSFTARASRVVDLLMTNTRPDSYVVAVTGEWGVGKTSMLNLVEEQFKLRPTEDEPIIVFRFSPLKLPERETVLSDFLLLLTNHLEAEAKKSETIKAKIGNRISTVKRYARSLQSINRKIAPFAPFLSILGINNAEMITGAMETITELVAEQENPPNIDDLYNKAYHTLLELKIPIVVTIDDLDRLNSSEIVKTLTLLRTTVQLPHITFVVTYDPSVVEEAIQQELATNGQDFLEKFVQVLVDVPLVSKDTLISRTVNQIESFFIQYEDKHVKSLGWESRITTDVIQEYTELGLVKTIRDSGRITNSVQFNSISKPQFSTFENFLRMAIFQVRAPRLYRWIGRSARKYHPVEPTFGSNNLTAAESTELSVLLNEYGLDENHSLTIFNMVSSYKIWRNQ